MSGQEADGKVGGELLKELFSAFEDLEAQSAGTLQFLKDKGLASDDELAPYLEAAAGASEVRWRAARLRMDVLLEAAIQEAEEEFARKMEERVQARNKLDAQEKEGRLAARDKAAKGKDVEGSEASGRKGDTDEGGQAPSAVPTEHAAKGTKEALGNKKAESGTHDEVPSPKAGPEPDNKRSGAAEKDTNRDAA